MEMVIVSFEGGMEGVCNRKFWRRHFGGDILEETFWRTVGEMGVLGM